MFRLRSGFSLKFTDENYLKHLEEAVEEKFDAVDFDIAGKWYAEEEEKEYYKHLEDGLKALKNTPLTLNGVHISFGNRWDISITEERARKNIVENIARVMERIDPAAPFCYILHGSFEPIAEDEREAKLGACIRSLRELKGYTSAKICAEVLPRTCLLNTSEEANFAADEAGVQICLDVNHLLKETPQEAVLKIGKRIAALHISDYDFTDEKHWMPGEGKIDWTAVLSALETIGYGGVFNYEVARPPEEIKKNYEELFRKYNEKKNPK